MDTNTKYLYDISIMNDSGIDPYDDLFKSLINKGFTELDACHETALYMNTVCNMMD